jgi:phosphoribosylformimino-5-aminoimidazole carboxamide ribotide isomerase
LEAAKQFEDAGLKRLHLVDLEGAKNGRITNIKILETIARNTNLIIDFGGGIKSDDDVQSVFDAGALMASVGSIAVKKPKLFFSWVEKFGSDKFLLGADVKDERLTINGWQTKTDLEIIPFLKDNFSKGVTQVFCTDISKDGLLQGTAVILYKKILKHLPQIKLIASGGVNNIKDVFELERIGCHGVIIGKAIYEGKVLLEELNHVGKENHSVS